MARTLEFFFDFISPFSYVAFHALPSHVDMNRTNVVFRPLFLGAVMKATGNRPPGMVPAKASYMAQDLARACRRYGLDFRMHPAFPMMNTRPVLRAACGLMDNPETQARFIELIFHHVWAAPDPLMTDDAEQVSALCRAGGLEAAAISRLTGAETSRAMLTTNTDEAIARGAFGAPSVFVGEELFFGHDRLDYAAEAVRQ